MGGYAQGARSVKVIIWITIGKTLDLLYFIHRWIVLFFVELMMGFVERLFTEGKSEGVLPPQ
ncbi:hypothetical protein VV1062A_01864 [Vibrio vulnificus]|nr:hypothetical protein VFL11327_04147 [Vibrio fluvialis]OJI55579.1 hypothetical protein VV1062A_01864 [Vibrio vulnificus]